MQTTSPTSRTARRGQGFTLIEVMIVVAIVAILAMVAIPSYRTYVLRGQLVDATTLLSTSSANMERYFQDNRSYASVGANSPPCSATQPVASRTQGSFVLSCNSDATTFTLFATGSDSTAAFVYTLDQLGGKTTVITSGPSGWNSSPTCWVVKNGQTC